MTYQGWSEQTDALEWTNYETWVVKLWIDNEEPNYRHWRAVAEELLDEDGIEDDEDRESVRIDLAERLKNEHEGAQPLTNSASVWSDLLTAALGEVNWREIACSLLEDAAEARATERA